MIEIPDSQISSTSQESSTDTAVTIILDPRSPEPTPQARRRSRMHGPGYCGNFSVLQVQVPDIYECMSGIVLSDMISGSARFHELVWQTEPPGQLVRDIYFRLPPRPDQQTNWSRYILAQPPIEKNSTAIVKAQPTKWSKESTRSGTHCRLAKTNLVESIDQNDEFDEEERASEE